MGQVTELQLSCYLVLLSADSKTRKQDNRTFVTWPIYKCVWYIYTHLNDLIPYTKEKQIYENMI